MNLRLGTHHVPEIYSSNRSTGSRSLVVIVCLLLAAPKAGFVRGVDLATSPKEDRRGREAPRAAVARQSIPPCAGRPQALQPR